MDNIHPVDKRIARGVFVVSHRSTHFCAFRRSDHLCVDASSCEQYLFRHFSAHVLCLFCVYETEGLYGEVWSSKDTTLHAYCGIPKVTLWWNSATITRRRAEIKREKCVFQMMCSSIISLYAERATTTYDSLGLILTFYLGPIASIPSFFTCTSENINKPIVFRSRKI